jgi:putative exosortase-associated protein (TIGR04073 family)
MKIRILAVALLAITAAAFGSATPAAAATSVEEASAQEIVGGMANKTVRGVANIATGWIEIPKQIRYTYVEEGPVKGIFVGPLKGIGMTIVRTVAGVAEFATFFLPLPGFYDPLVDPAYPWQKE